MIKDIANSAEGLGFGSRAVQIGRNDTNGSPQLRRFFGAVLRYVTYALTRRGGPRSWFQAWAYYREYNIYLNLNLHVDTKPLLYITLT